VARSERRLDQSGAVRLVADGLEEGQIREVLAAHPGG
jgi:hypothetical protein